MTRLLAPPAVATAPLSAVSTTATLAWSMASCCLASHRVKSMTSSRKSSFWRCANSMPCATFLVLELGWPPSHEIAPMTTLGGLFRTGNLLDQFRKTKPRAERTIPPPSRRRPRSEEHTSELQSHVNLVCRLLLEKKKNSNKYNTPVRLN